jgi:hypothetical protein
MPPCPPLTPIPASGQQDIYLHTDDNNMPATSVGRTSYKIMQTKYVVQHLKNSTVTDDALNLFIYLQEVNQT